MTPTLIQADYHNQRHADDIGYLMNCYARDPMGGNAALPKEIINNIAKELSKRDFAFTVLCYVDKKPAGLINCFEAFSTFACQPLINIHDVIVEKSFRGQQISIKMLSKVEEIAKARGCCKITMEVLQGNEVAKNAYKKFGFGAYELDPVMGSAMFWQKPITHHS
ncbi:MAG: GNAT family N-acetyltransferase [Cellvibrionaceae bacterium]